MRCSKPQGPESSPPRPRFDYLHGLRGLAALSVVLFHATLNARASQHPVLRSLQAPLLHGYLAVPAFLVLSGFLLSVPVVTNGYTLRGGLGGFLKRRALRILPPYYAAYLLHMLFFAAAAGLASILGKYPGGRVMHQLQIGYRPPTVLAHLLLVHNLSEEWVLGMNAILWTIACEWQIYLLFAVVLVPTWRRFGTVPMLAICTLLSAVLAEANVRGWCSYIMPAMIPAFGVGMVSGLVVTGESPVAAAMRRWPWRSIVVASCLATCVGVGLMDALLPASPSRTSPVAYYAWSFRVRWIYDLLAATATAAITIWLALDARQGDRGASCIRRMLERQPLLGLGLFSYSLYLTHGIAIVIADRATAFLLHRPTLHDAVLMATAVGLSLAVAYGFYLCVERHCMSGETRAMFAASNELRDAAETPMRVTGESGPRSSCTGVQ
jgi:peptidoglycan/LPS O-acetylase OafA/YrhL